jgi:hypothetical protein
LALASHASGAERSGGRKERRWKCCSEQIRNKRSRSTKSDGAFEEEGYTSERETRDALHFYKRSWAGTHWEWVIWAFPVAAPFFAGTWLAGAGSERVIFPLKVPKNS